MREDSHMLDPGLCARCRHSRRVEGARTLFWRCARSDTDAAYPRYPALPVLRCAGFEPAEPAPDPLEVTR